uniref:Ornithine aminotransferase n=1 Tax=Euplotes harpa TaxID=151035 RepID=A0A7S3IZG9_9SPIT|mmetsp:Transcript_11365/g.12881  ORF Transcript_11365/g.12881 Transcript_11365/m.12881 type:complete len:391 (+) Transcript_11365:103-1275(+)
MAHNYAVLEPVIARAERCWMWDVEGKKYLDFHSGYCSANQGHCHPKIVDTLIRQVKILTTPSRAFDNDQTGAYAELMCKTFGYDKILPSNSGVEACESAVKLARRWGYVVKGVPENKAEVLFPNGCFWGRSITAISGCDDPMRYEKFGPFTPGFPLVPYNDLDALEKMLESHPNIVAYMTEPIQGEGGVIIPDKGYLREAHKLLKKHNCLMICDEIQTGLGRTGKMLCVHHEDDFRPDMVTLGKSTSGGLLPLSLVMADDEVMLTIKPGEHGSTFGGNALACAVGKTALEVIIEEDLCKKSEENGAFLVRELKNIKSKFIKEARGKGLFCSLELNEKGLGKHVIASLNRNGLACKNTHDTTIRLAPPLITTKEELTQGVEIIEKTLKEFE